MSDLISRQAAIDAICKECYDTDGEICNRNDVCGNVMIIRNLPSAQPEIIRCKDCRHRDAETGFCEGRGWPMQLVPDDGFCDKGERRWEE